jgi:hypothetical protein
MTVDVMAPYPSSPSGWDREFESGLLQQRVSNEPGRSDDIIEQLKAVKRLILLARPGGAHGLGGLRLAALPDGSAPKDPNLRVTGGSGITGGKTKIIVIDRAS